MTYIDGGTLSNYPASNSSSGSIHLGFVAIYARLIFKVPYMVTGYDFQISVVINMDLF